MMTSHPQAHERSSSALSSSASSFSSAPSSPTATSTTTPRPPSKRIRILHDMGSSTSSSYFPPPETPSSSLLVPPALAAAPASTAAVHHQSHLNISDHLHSPSPDRDLQSPHMHTPQHGQGQGQGQGHGRSARDGEDSELSPKKRKMSSGHDLPSAALSPTTSPSAFTFSSSLLSPMPPRLPLSASQPVSSSNFLSSPSSSSPSHSPSTASATRPHYVQRLDFSRSDDDEEEEQRPKLPRTGHAQLVEEEREAESSTSKSSAMDEPQATLRTPAMSTRSSSRARRGMEGKSSQHQHEQPSRSHLSIDPSLLPSPVSATTPREIGGGSSLPNSLRIDLFSTPHFSSSSASPPPQTSHRQDQQQMHQHQHQHAHLLNTPAQSPVSFHLQSPQTVDKKTSIGNSVTSEQAPLPSPFSPFGFFHPNTRSSRHPSHVGETNESVANSYLFSPSPSPSAAAAAASSYLPLPTPSGRASPPLPPSSSSSSSSDSSSSPSLSAERGDRRGVAGGSLAPSTAPSLLSPASFTSNSPTASSTLSLTSPLPASASQTTSPSSSTVQSENQQGIISPSQLSDKSSPPLHGTAASSTPAGASIAAAAGGAGGGNASMDSRVVGADGEGKDSSHSIPRPSIGPIATGNPPAVNPAVGLLLPPPLLPHPFPPPTYPNPFPLNPLNLNLPSLSAPFPFPGPPPFGFFPTPPPAPIAQSTKPCKCKKSQCLKLYCECFARGVLCSSGCMCVNCCNTNRLEDREKRERAVWAVMEKSRDGFYRGLVKNRTDKDTKVKDEGKLKDEVTAEQTATSPISASTGAVPPFSVHSSSPNSSQPPLSSLPSLLPPTAASVAALSNHLAFSNLISVQQLVHAHNWTPEDLKRHADLMLSKLAAHREESLLQQNILSGAAMQLPHALLSGALAAGTGSTASSFSPRAGSNIYHPKGCSCKRSACKKKYCECFLGGFKCGPLCKCVGCKNGKEETGEEEKKGTVAVTSNSSSPSGVSDERTESPSVGMEKDKMKETTEVHVPPSSSHAKSGGNMPADRSSTLTFPPPLSPQSVRDGGAGEMDAEGSVRIDSSGETLLRSSKRRGGGNNSSRVFSFDETPTHKKGDPSVSAVSASGPKNGGGRREHVHVRHPGLSPSGDGLASGAAASGSNVSENPTRVAEHSRKRTRGAGRHDESQQNNILMVS